VTAAVASIEPCSTCAFFVPISGSFRMLFGACANEWSPSDGRVVSVDHGCGAHSQTDAERRLSEWPGIEPVVDSGAIEPLDLLTEPEPEPQSAVDGADQAPDVTEPEITEEAIEVTDDIVTDNDATDDIVTEDEAAAE
jgi:hypothetical protein